MPASQLKRLKASLRDQGVLGPQQSKREKKKNHQNGNGKDKRVQRIAALEGIREQFNPFEFKLSARGPKFEVANNRNLGGKSNGIKSRPSVSRGLGEDNRRKTLLIEMQRRNKVGGIIDRRFGENDPSMALEDKMLERFAQEVQQRHKNRSVFDLEDDEDENGIQLTHMGQSLSFDEPALEDDFNEDDLALSDEDDNMSGRKHENLKRRRDDEEEEDSADDQTPERKKTKQEVMKEIIMKSKMYKYERQAVKDVDEDMREALDQEMTELHTILRGDSFRRQPANLTSQGINPERAALINGSDKSYMDKEYDLRLRQLAQDKKAAPTERTKTEDEIAAEESQKLRNLEAQRLRRMQGIPDDEEDMVGADEEGQDMRSDVDDDDNNFGLGSGIKAKVPRELYGVEDEDEFVIDDDLVTSGSELEGSDDDMDAATDGGSSDDGSDFLNGLLAGSEAGKPDFLTGSNAAMEDVKMPTTNGVNGELAFTYPCPQSHTELLSITETIAIEDLPTVVQRIRALYHPKLSSDNKRKLANFTIGLIDHIVYLANLNQLPSSLFTILESLIRHVHSLTKTYPVEVANSFRSHLQALQDLHPLNPELGDLVLLTAVGTVFPTSDHFHQVVTPATLSIARYLGQKVPQTLADYATGLYLTTLCLQYQRLSKRYIPEASSFLLNTLCALAPKSITAPQISFHYHEPKIATHVKLWKDLVVRPMNILDVKHLDESSKSCAALETALLQTTLDLLLGAAETWMGKAAFSEVFDPATKILKMLGKKSHSELLPRSIQISVTKAQQKISVLLAQAQLARRPLELHHHRPLAIKTSIPKFEESFDPDKHYDPDRDRAEAAKLRAEHKRERKGALRELRKDANFMARESLRQKKERDTAYEKKYKRLVAEIQGEEGREAKEYEREKIWRKKGRK